MPIGSGEAALLLERTFAQYSHVVLAVSGGADSTALMHLAADWRRHRPRPAPTISVATVDHGLRPDSADEAVHVGAMARSLGFQHTTLTWAGRKPATGIQAAARQARYQLLEAHLAENGWTAIATAHTRDDQAETLLLRLARGSGIDGLSGMLPETAMGTMVVLRPLLTVAKSRLIASLQARDIDWIEDPSNERDVFERVRIRRAHDALAAIGLINDRLALSARRLQRARSALEAMVDGEIARASIQLQMSMLGYADLDWDWVRALPSEIALRLLARLISAVGGNSEPVSLGQLEAMTEQRNWAKPAGLTLAGVQVVQGGGNRVTFAREPGRAGLPVITLRPGERLLWDNRFEVAVNAAHCDVFEVAALGEEGLCRIDTALLAGLPRSALRALPAFRRMGELVAVPLIEFFSAPRHAQALTTRFMNWPGKRGKSV